MSSTPSATDKKRVATSPLDSFDYKKTRTLSTDSSASTMADYNNLPLDETQLKQLSEQVSSSLEAILPDMVKSIVSKVIEALQNRMSAIQDENSSLKERVSDLEKRVELLEIDHEASDQYSRRNCLRISGIKEENSESMTDIIKNLSAEIQANIDVHDIDNMHRLGRPNSNTSSGKHPHRPNNQTRPRDIIIKFTSYRARQSLLSCRSALINSKLFERVFINEELSNLLSVRGVRGRVVKVVDFKPLVSHRCVFESR
jgi:hypothetical protein